MITKDTLRKVIYEQRARQCGDMVRREVPDRLLQCPEVLVISGVRRCGKSVLLQQIKEAQGERDYALNFDDDRLIRFEVEDFQVLQEVFMEDFGEQHHYYLDEVQNIPGWERFVSRLYAGGNKVFVTGSNARLLSRELGTFLTGRHMTLTLYPFSFREYLTLKRVKLTPEKMYTTQGTTALVRAFRDYLQQGGFPQYLSSGEPNYLSALYNDILYKDVMVRNRLTNEKQMRELMYFTMSNIAHRCTYNSLAKQIDVKSVDTVKSYMSFVEDTYLISQVNRYDHSSGMQVRSPKKIYAIDNALIRRIGFHTSDEWGTLLENAACIELMRRGMEVFYYAGKGECDFIVRQQGGPFAAYQVTVSLNEEKTRQREIDGLIEAMESFQLDEGWILTLEENEEIERNGRRIHVMALWKWSLA
jgi:hypothetical protein